jgi:hypothetical protein
MAAVSCPERYLSSASARRLPAAAQSTAWRHGQHNGLGQQNGKPEEELLQSPSFNRTLAALMPTNILRSIGSMNGIWLIRIDRHTIFYLSDCCEHCDSLLSADSFSAAGASGQPDGSVAKRA